MHLLCKLLAVSDIITSLTKRYEYQYHQQTL